MQSSMTSIYIQRGSRKTILDSILESILFGWVQQSNTCE